MPMTADRERIASFLMTLRAEESMSGRLMEAVEAISRRLFVPAGVEDCYADQSFPIPCGQTMASARFAVRLVAAMKIQPEHRILEIGTGSGYVTALLARMGLHVVTLDRYRTLLAEASDRLKTCSLTNTTFVHEDGRNGHPELAPFDRIVIHGAFSDVPRPLIEQMASQGILLSAIGPANGVQRIVRQQKLGSRFEEERLFPVRLQPLETGTASFL